MLIRFLKKHINWKPGEEVDFDESMGSYLIRCNVAESADADPAKTEAILLRHLQGNKPNVINKKNKIKVPA